MIIIYQLGTSMFSYTHVNFISYLKRGIPATGWKVVRHSSEYVACLFTARVVRANNYNYPKTVVMNIPNMAV